jgi:hypothetical protein
MRAPKLPFVFFALLGCNEDYQVAKESARIVVTPELADAGAVAVGDTVSLEVSLVHAGGDTVRVLALDVLPLDGDAFTGPGEPYPEVASDQTETLAFTFAPESEGYFRSRVTIHTDEVRDNEHVVVLRGQAAIGNAEVLPSIVDFGPVAAGGSAEATVSLVNIGAVPLSLESLTFEGDGFASILLLPATVGVGGTVDVPMTYRAADADEATGTLTLSVSPAVPLATVQLRANACSTAGGPLYDADGDGYSACGVDCDDGDADVNPVGAESCDGTDEDCDGLVDEGTRCADDDGDGASEDEGDCNDGDPAVGPAIVEVDGNGVDDDCDGAVDGGSTDADGDGYDPTGGDCDDGDASVFPGAPEQADGVDDNCDGVVDEDTTAYDDDGDGVTEDAGDCDDTTTVTRPGATELADWKDNDCDGTVDEGTTNADDDGDGVSERGGDCDDTEVLAYPGAVELSGDGIDNDCDGTVE